MMLSSLAGLARQGRQNERGDLRVGSHKVTFLLLALGPVLERTLRQIDPGDSLGDDVGAESLADRFSSHPLRYRAVLLAHL